MSSEMDPNAEVLNETRFVHALHKQNTNSELSDEKRDSHTEGLTAMRMLAIVALAFTDTGSQIHSLLLGAGNTFMAEGLHIGANRSWIPVANSLASACVALTVGYFQDLFGRKVPLAIGLLLMIAGTAVMASSHGFAQSVAGSAMTGVAGALQELGAIAAIAEMVPARQRGVFLALNTSLTLLFTPALLYAELLGPSRWRWLFGIVLFWNVIALVLMSVTYFRMKLTRESHPSGNVGIKDFDFIGAGLLIVGLTILLVALESGGTKHPWNSAYFLCMFIIGLVLLIIFVVWESRGYGRPLLPFRIFRGQRVVGVTLLLCAMSSAISFATVNLGPQIINTVFSFSPVGYGLIALGPSISLAVGAIAFNVLLTVLHGHARELMTVAAVLMTAFGGAQAVIDPSNSTLFAILGSFASLGIGGTLVPIQTIVTLACPQDLIGTAIALTSTVRTVGGIVGYAILYNVFYTNSKPDVRQQMAPRVVEAGLPRNETAAFIQQFSLAMTDGAEYPPANAKIQEAATIGFHLGTAMAAQLVYYISIAFGGLAIIFALALPDTREYMTNRVLAKSQAAKA